MGNLSSVIPPAARKPGPFHQGLCDQYLGLYDLERSRDEVKSHEWSGMKEGTGESPLLGIQACGGPELTLMDFKRMLIRH